MQHKNGPYSRGLICGEVCDASKPQSASNVQYGARGKDRGFNMLRLKLLSVVEIRRDVYGLDREGSLSPLPRSWSPPVFLSTGKLYVYSLKKRDAMVYTSVSQPFFERGALFFVVSPRGTQWLDHSYLLAKSTCYEAAPHEICSSFVSVLN
jgi:hypothetical protein